MEKGNICCPGCGCINPPNFDSCRKCGSTLSQEKTQNVSSIFYCSPYKEKVKVVGWIYFWLSLLGSFIFILVSVSNKIDYVTVIDYSLFSYGIVAILQAFLVLFVCLSLSEILHQNELLINFNKSNEEPE